MSQSQLLGDESDYGTDDEFICYKCKSPRINRRCDECANLCCDKHIISSSVEEGRHWCLDCYCEVYESSESE